MRVQELQVQNSVEVGRLKRHIKRWEAPHGVMFTPMYERMRLPYHLFLPNALLYTDGPQTTHIQGRGVRL